MTQNQVARYQPTHGPFQNFKGSNSPLTLLTRSFTKAVASNCRAPATAEVLGSGSMLSVAN